MGSKEQQYSLPSVLIDTPIWLDYFRKEEGIFREVNDLMDAGRVCCSDLGAAELLLTAQNRQEMKVFQDFTRIFPILKEPNGAWVQAAKLAFKWRQKGRECSLRDCYIVLLAKANGALLYTTNKEILQAGKRVGLKFFPKGNL